MYMTFLRHSFVKKIKFKSGENERFNRHFYFFFLQKTPQNLLIGEKSTALFGLMIIDQIFIIN
jgi:hypothetical protein